MLDSGQFSRNIDNLLTFFLLNFDRIIIIPSLFTPECTIQLYLWICLAFFSKTPLNRVKTGAKRLVGRRFWLKIESLIWKQQKAQSQTTKTHNAHNTKLFFEKNKNNFTDNNTHIGGVGRLGAAVQIGVGIEGGGDGLDSGFLSTEGWRIIQFSKNRTK